MVGPDRTDFGRLVLGDLTPDRFRRLLRAAVNGDGAQVNDVYDQVLRLDGHLRSVVGKRRSAMRRLEWEIVAAQADEGDEDFNADFAAEVAQYCRRALRRCHGLESALDHLDEAVGRGIAAVELEWGTDQGERRPIRAHRIPHTRLAFDTMDPWRLRITSEKDFRGFAVDELPPGKFIVHAPEGDGASAMASGLLLPSAWLVFFKKFGWNFYWQTLEAFGAPMVTATYPPGSAAEVIDGVITMLQRVGKLRNGAFPQGTEFKFHEPASSSGAGKGPPHPAAIEMCNAEISKLWLGGTLMTEVGSTGGNRAVADVQNEGLTAHRDDDAGNKSATVIEQMLRPIVLYKFGEAGLDYVPVYRHVIERVKDIEAMARTAAIVVNGLGAPVPTRYVKDELDLPLVEDADLDAPLAGQKTGLESLDFGATDAEADEASADRVANRGHDGARARRQAGGGPSLRMVANSLMDKIRSRGGSLARIVPWMVAAVVASQAHTAAVAESLGAALKREEESISTEADVGRVLASAFGSLPIDDMVTLTRHALLAGELAGRAVALEKIGGKARAVRNSRGQNFTGSGVARVVNAAKIDFPRIPFVAAIERLRDRIGLEPDEFLKLDAEARSRAWRVAGVWNMDLLAVLHTQLVSAIAAGETVRDFRQSVIGQMYDRAGWSGENPWHSNIVFFQNFAMAHAAGRYREYVELGIEAYRIVSVGPACPICEPEIGKVYPVAKPRKYTPFHMGCDCEEEPVLPGELQPGELSDPDLVSNPALDAELARKGSLKWDVASYGAMGPLNLAKYPESLRPAFADLAAKQGWETVQ